MGIFAPSDHEVMHAFGHTGVAQAWKLFGSHAGQKRLGPKSSPISVPLCLVHGLSWSRLGMRRVAPHYCWGALTPRMNSCISCNVTKPSLLASIALKIRS